VTSTKMLVHLLAVTEGDTSVVS